MTPHTITVSPQAGSGGGNVTTDANITAQFFDNTFASIHGGNGAAMTVSPSTRSVLRGSGTSNQFDFYGCYFGTFDTSAIGASGTVTSAKLRLYGNGTKQNDLGGNFDTHVSAAAQAAANAVANTDWPSRGATSFGSLAYASWDSGGWNEITFNGSGLAAINKTGITELCARFGDDMNGSFTGVWGSGLTSIVNWQSADDAHPPELVVNYLAP